MKYPVICAGFPGALGRRLQKTAERFPQTPINICAVSDTEMMHMNRQFRKKNKTTDVLTFVYPELIEIYISLPVARKQARERKVTLDQECQRLLVHGMCHALGMDHHTRDDFMEMRRREFEVLVQCEIV